MPTDGSSEFCLNVTFPYGRNGYNISIFNDFQDDVRCRDKCPSDDAADIAPTFWFVPDGDTGNRKEIEVLNYTL